jgi:hypothetical protein
VSARAAVGSALFACALIGLVGCSGSPGSAAGSSKLAGEHADRPPDACEAQPLAGKDVAGILMAPITGAKTVSGDSQSCEYSTGSFPAIIVSVRPGLGKSRVDSWIAGRMPLKANPLPGVGDAAVWQPSLHELIAQKGDLLCDVHVRGGITDIALSADALASALGALCNRIFAAG